MLTSTQNLRRRIAAAVVTVSALGAVAVPGAAQAAPTGPSYVALGDSYSSLPAEATVGTSAQERACGRSTHNYPKQVAASLGLHGEALRDNTCGGAKTDDVFGSQHAGDASTGYYDAAPQLTGISSATTLVTVSLGGNDEDLYSGLLEACAHTAGTPVPCTADQSTRPRSFSDAAIDARLNRITAANARIVRAVRERAPKARVVLVGYPVVFSSEHSCAKIAAYDSASVAWMRTVLTTRLNQAMRRAATNERADYVDMEPATREHGICTTDPWINGTQTVPRAAAVHPFPEEGDAVATAVLQRLRTSAPS